MSVRLSALLCLTGLAACSNNTNQPPAQDATYANQPTQAATEPAMKPASFEHSTASSTTSAPDQRSTAASSATPSQSDRSAASDRSATTNTRPATDTKNTASGASKASDDTQNSAPADTAPDNTKVNKRDANSAALTPMDQGNGKTDLKITQEIRQAIMANGSLSFTAKNVKVITQGGKVTLRGPVKSDQERSDIEAAARKVAGVTEVDNQLEVKK